MFFASCRGRRRNKSRSSGNRRRRRGGENLLPVQTHVSLSLMPSPNIQLGSPGILAHPLQNLVRYMVAKRVGRDHEIRVVLLEALTEVSVAGQVRQQLCPSPVVGVAGNANVSHRTVHHLGRGGSTVYYSTWQHLPRSTPGLSRCECTESLLQDKAYPSKLPSLPSPLPRE